MLFVPWIKSENKKEKTFAAANARVLAPLGRRHCHCSRDRSVSAASPAMQSVMCAPIWSVTRRLWNGFQLPFRLRVAFSDSPPFSCLLPAACCLPPFLPQVGSLNFWWWLPERFAVMSECPRGCGAAGRGRRWVQFTEAGALLLLLRTSLWASSAKRKLIYLSLRFGERILHIVRKQHLHTWAREEKSERGRKNQLMATFLLIFHNLRRRKIVRAELFFGRVRWVRRVRGRS